MKPPAAIHDVAIVGAGPAGATLALELLREGASPVLLDQARFPRTKVCGGGLTVKALKFLPPTISEVLANEIDRVNLSYGLRRNFTKAAPQPLMYTVDRRHFDAALVARVKAAGGEVREGERVEQVRFGQGDAATLVTSRGHLKARVIVGADGVRSCVARSSGLQPADFWHLGLQAEVPRRLVDRDAFDWSRTVFLDLGTMADGYAWVFPRGDLLLIGAGGLLQHGAQLKRYWASLLSYLGLAPHACPIQAHLIPHRIGSRPIGRDRVILVGDAAGLTDYWTGEGIYYALASAKLAAPPIVRFLRGDTHALSEYQTRVNREIMPELATSYQFSKIYNYLGRAAFCCLEHYAYAWEVFCRLMRGDRSFVELKKSFRPDIFCRKLLVKSARNRPFA
jgi:geranylgeranyl reductase family protein